MKKVLSIAGSDCSGGAGIQADLKTFSAHGIFGMSVIVSVVAENTSRVIDIQDITPDMIEKQIDAVFEDIEVDAVKIGMLSTPECMKAVAKKLLQYKPQNVVIDPVMYAKNGCPLMNPTAVSTLIDTVIPLADVLTPNIPEAEKIADMQISTVSDMEAAARKIYAMGCKAIVVKGGHHIGNAVDVLFNLPLQKQYRHNRMVQIIWELAQCSLLELKPTLILYQWRNYRKSAQPFLCRSLLLAVSIKEIQGVSSPWELTGWLLYLPS